MKVLKYKSQILIVYESNQSFKMQNLKTFLFYKQLKKYFVISISMINTLIHEKQHKRKGFIYLLIPGREIKIIGT